MNLQKNPTFFRDLNTTGDPQSDKSYIIRIIYHQFWMPSSSNHYDRGQNFFTHAEDSSPNEFHGGNVNEGGTTAPTTLGDPNQLVYSAGGAGGTDPDNKEFLLLLIPFILLCGILVLLIAMLVLRARLSRLLKRQIEAQNSRRHLASMYRASTMSRSLGLGNPSNCYAEAPSLSRKDSTNSRRSLVTDVVLPTIHENATFTPPMSRSTNPPGGIIPPRSEASIQNDVNYADIYMSRPITTRDATHR